MEEGENGEQRIRKRNRRWRREMGQERGRRRRKGGTGKRRSKDTKEKCSHSVNSSHFLSLVRDRECGKKDLSCPARQMH